MPSLTIFMLNLSGICRSFIHINFSLFFSYFIFPPAICRVKPYNCKMTAIQVLITMIWMIVEPAGTRFYYPNRKEVILKCNIQDMSFLFSQLYNMILITICTVYAVKTRKIPENFNESKFIGFTMYTTCIIWLAFIPIYFGTGNSYEVSKMKM